MRIVKSVIIWISGISVLVLLFPLSFIIWILTLPFDRERIIIHWILVYQGMLVARIISFRKIDITGREKIVHGTTYVIISNHQSLIDTLLLYYIRYKFKWISKIENTKVPILGWYLKMADYIIVNRGNEESKIEMLEKSYRTLKKGISIMIFPEGTRSLNTEIGFFKRGAFQLAIQANVPILPLLIDGTGGILPKHGLIFNPHFRLKLKVLEPLLPSSFETSNPDDLALRLSSLMASELKELRLSDLTR
jgi:1-acyl-sn-glycerol-3-phosphate acyltransferase